MYTVEKSDREIKTDEYIREYVNVEEFLEKCRECPNYGRLWSCPPYDFDPVSVWSRYDKLYVTARKIIFDEEQRSSGTDAIMEILKEVKDNMSSELFDMEKKYPGSLSLSAGSCSMCRGMECTRTEKKPCRYPDQMRYSIESLGGNVGLTVSRLMGIELEWIEEGKMPSYFVLVAGLLMYGDISGQEHAMSRKDQENEEGAEL